MDEQNWRQERIDLEYTHLKKNSHFYKRFSISISFSIASLLCSSNFFRWNALHCQFEVSQELAIYENKEIFEKMMRPP